MSEYKSYLQMELVVSDPLVCDPYITWMKLSRPKLRGVWLDGDDNCDRFRVLGRGLAD